AYIRESILQPNAKIVAGYQPLMPTFQGQLTEEQIFALIAYIKSLQSQPVPATGAGIAPPTGKR
ncbi:MAG: cytochrome c oxidase subunit II, partial [Acidobacteria bacterium]